MSDTMSYNKWCNTVSGQRRRLLEKTGRALVLCLACKKLFVIHDEDNELLFCSAGHSYMFYEKYRNLEFSLADVCDDRVVGVIKHKGKERVERYW